MKLDLVYCRSCKSAHEPGKHKARSSGDGIVKQARKAIASVPAPEPFVPAKAEPKKSAKPSTITFERDREAYNAYQRDYKRARKEGITVKAYRAKKVTS